MPGSGYYSKKKGKLNLKSEENKYRNPLFGNFLGVHFIISQVTGKKRQLHGILNASWKICSLVVNGQSFLDIDGYLLNLF
jgi:hypothetical protein